MLQNKNEKIPYVQVKQKNAKVENLIKSTPSRLHHTHQRRGLILISFTRDDTLNLLYNANITNNLMTVFFISLLFGKQQ